MKRHEVLCNYCGRRFKVWEKLWLLKFIIFGEKRYVQCPYCQKTSQYHLVWHSPHDIINSDEREQHKQLEERWGKG